MRPPRDDASNGFDAVAPAYIAGRGCEADGVGAAVVRGWAAGLAPRGAVLDVGCGPGVPVTQALVDAGLRVCAVDPSPRMLAAFRVRFPGIRTDGASAETSRFLGAPYDAAFDGVVAWGLLFLLEEDAQALVIARVAHALAPGGRFLFTAPAQVCAWRDAQTGRLSRSLGAARYTALLAAGGLTVAGTATDEGENHYYFAHHS